jgi:3-amino-5-hydroxybenzoate synthase
LSGLNCSISTSSGTTALEVALRALGIGFGDEVIVPAYTFMSSASAVLSVFAIPIPVDVDRDTHCIDPDCIDEAITERTKAIIPVHVGGNSCDSVRIMSLAVKYRLKVVDDCAQSHGAVANYGPVGSFADAACFSLQSSKVIAAGEGGIASFKNSQAYLRAENICNYGWVPNGTPYGHFTYGGNYRMSELTACFALAQMETLEKYRMRRDHGSKYFKYLLMRDTGLRFQEDSAVTQKHGRFFFPILLNERTHRGQYEVVENLVEQGVPARRTYPAFSDTPFFNHLDREFRVLGDRGLLPNYASFELGEARRIAQSGFWLPHWLLLEPEKTLNEVSEIILQTVKR